MGISAPGLNDRFCERQAVRGSPPLCSESPTGGGLSPRQPQPFNIAGGQFDPRANPARTRNRTSSVPSLGFSTTESMWAGTSQRMQGDGKAGRRSPAAPSYARRLFDSGPRRLGLPRLRAKPASGRIFSPSPPDLGSWLTAPAGCQNPGQTFPNFAEYLVNSHGNTPRP